LVSPERTCPEDILALHRLLRRWICQVGGSCRMRLHRRVNHSGPSCRPRSCFLGIPRFSKKTCIKSHAMTSQHREPSSTSALSVHVKHASSLLRHAFRSNRSHSPPVVPSSTVELASRHLPHHQHLYCVGTLLPSLSITPLRAASITGLAAAHMHVHFVAPYIPSSR
jgi:hypothetical protein